jgi:N-acetylated-alpha-linked acidic dipeptidase
VQDPETGLSAWKRDQLRQIANASTPERRQEARTRTDLRISALGSGSDYTGFMQHDGIASLNIGFGGEDEGGIYHSIYDDFYWYTHFSDMEFVFGRALSQAGGSAVMRLADADLLPLEFGNFVDTMQMYVRELKNLSQKMRDDTTERNREIEEGVFRATDDPRKKLVAPARQPVPPFLNFAPLDNATEALARSAAEYRKALEQANANGGAALVNASIAKVNRMLIDSERKLAPAAGLPGRPWFKHLIYAPGQYTGYEAKTLPAVREAIEQKQWPQADEAIVVVAGALQDEAALISSAAAELATEAQHANGAKP